MRRFLSSSQQPPPRPPPRPARAFLSACLPVPSTQGDSASQGRERDAGWHSVKELIEK